MEYRAILNLSGEEYDELLSRGWRRMGYTFFRPACPGCSSCLSLRLRVHSFAATKSQRRNLQRNSSVRVVVDNPSLSEEHLALWAAYHRFMREHRGWPESEITPRSYAESFLLGDFSFSREFRYYEGSRLIAVGLVDTTAISLSSIYFYHDPEYRSRGIGVYSVLKEIEHARENGLRFSYLGYWVKECQSMAYKAQFGPHQLLEGYPADDAEPVWLAL